VILHHFSFNQLALAFDLQRHPRGGAQWTNIPHFSGVAMFVVGWAIQFVGHHYEGRKPAFVDDVTGLIVGPLFVVAELAFMLGLRH
jgi:uncharacterized membrane protein YGL010W